ncbi:MAG: T9SS type A sorting domain-containing protein [Bacteroidia bacterium]|nr:T9SS type A sorting domain-containing protein [Bacteroidia bacterium]
MKGKLKTIALCGFLFAGLAKGLSQNPLWTLPSKYLKGGSIYNLPVLTGGYSGQTAAHGHNSMINAQENLKFYIVDNKVYNASGALIDEMYYPGGTISGVNFDEYVAISGTSETVIVPDPAPGKCNRYYILLGGTEYEGTTNSDRMPFWGLLDLDAPGYSMNMIPMLSMVPVGEWTTSFPVKLGNVHIAATDRRSDGSYFVYVSGLHKVWRFKITASGITYDNYSFALPSGSGYEVRAEMEIASLTGGGYRIAVPYQKTGGGCSVYTAELTSAGTVISGTERVFDFYKPVGSTEESPFVHGLEFSANGGVLYLTRQVSVSNPGAVQFFDFSNPTAGLQTLNVPNADYYQFTQIERGKDGWMYFARQNGSTNTANYFSVLGNSNTPSTSASWISANWLNAIIGISYPASFQGFPASSSYNNMKSYLLPDQIDGMNYTSHLFSDLSCCLANTPYTIDSYTATASGTWQAGIGQNPFSGIINSSNTVTVRKELRIPAGVTVNITNMIFRFAPGAKVIIERGVINGASSGKLILNGTTFTVETSCDAQAMWEGVEVWGYSNQNQTTSQTTNKQGFLSVENNSLIEHAKTGAMAVRALSGSTFDVNYTGGIIQGSASTFRNNVIDVRFMNYNAPNLNPNLSYFNNCRFITNGLLNNPSLLPQYHAYLYEVNGVSFRGSDFKNETPASYTYNQTGYGIYAYNSKINVTYLCNNIMLPCTSFDFGSFENLYYGIYATTSNTARNLVVNRINFTNVIRGIHHTGAAGSTFLLNNFQVDAYHLIQTWGLNMANCTGYRVEENTFTQYNYASGTPGYDSYGVIVTNSGSVHNEIYKNSFHDIKVGVRAQGNNGTIYDVVSGNPDPNAAVGLQILCNTFYGNMYKADIEVSSGRIDYQQGLCSNNTLTPAGNTFSHSTNTTDNDISVGAGVLFFTYAHHPDAPRTPQYFDAMKLNLDACSNVSFSAASCPTKISEGIIIIRDKMLSKPDSLRSEIQRGEALLNGGSKEALLESIRTGNSRKMSEALLAASPFVSADVLAAYIQTAPHYTDAAEILLRNAPLPPALLQETELLGWPADVMADIYKAQESTPALAEVQQRISLMGKTREEYINRMLSEIQAAPEQYQADDIAALLIHESSQARKQQLCDYYIDRRDLARAREINRELVALYGYDNYSKLAEIQMAMLSSEAYLQSGIIDPAWIRMAEEIAGDPTDMQNAMKAMAFIAFAKDSMIEFLAEPMTAGVVQQGEHRITDKKTIAQVSVISVYPNPADGMVTIELGGPGAFTSGGLIEILNMSGQKVREIKIAAAGKRVYFDAGSLEPGVYMLRVQTGTDISEVKKLIVR